MKKFKYTYWLKMEDDMIEQAWINLKEYKEKYDCNIEVYYRDTSFINKIIKLECNQEYNNLDLDVNSMFTGSLIRLSQKPNNISKYNKPVEYFFLKNIKGDKSMDLEDYLRKRIKEYDKKQEELNKEWESLHDLKPKDMNEYDFRKLIQKARYETKQENLDREMIDNFVKQNPVEVKEYIYKGADKFKLYDYAEKTEGKNLTMIQGWILEDLHNIKKGKHFSYIHDKEISDPKTITTEEFNKLYEKYENDIEFTNDELDYFLIKYDDGTYTAINNTSGNLYTEDFSSLKSATRYLQGMPLYEIREEECKYEVNIYETKEDYNKGEPFQLNVYSNLNEAINDLNNTIKFNNFYAGNVLNQETGEEEYSNIPDENIVDLDDEEEDEL